MRTPKLFIGQNLRQIRDDHALTQARFAEQLGISTSYLNQLENNQRHVTASVLLALAEHFAVDIATLSDNDSDRLLADMGEVFADPLFDGKRPAARELELVAQSTPSMARALITMHQALRRAGEQLAEMDNTLSSGGIGNEPTPYEEVRDFFHYLDNYEDTLDRAAESLAASVAGEGGNGDRVMAFRHYIERTHGVRTRLADEAGATQWLRRFDADTRVLTINPQVSPSTQAFQIAHQVALLEHRDTIDRLVSSAGFRTPDAGAICTIGLANYFAGAALLPYQRFLDQARAARHDLESLAWHFGASVEQVAHRLSTLQRPGARGIPFFFARVDQAGNITKRHSATKLQFARFGSACPLWNVHTAFEQPGRMLRQLAETPDGVRYLCLAITVEKPAHRFGQPVQRHALALGCEIVHADALVYADTLDTGRSGAFEPIGVSCRLCERGQCHQRAVPPLKRALDIDLDTRQTLPYRLR